MNEIMYGQGYGHACEQVCLDKTDKMTAPLEEWNTIVETLKATAVKGMIKLKIKNVSVNCTSVIFNEVQEVLDS